MWFPSFNPSLEPHKPTLSTRPSHTRQQATAQKFIKTCFCKKKIKKNKGSATKTEHNKAKEQCQTIAFSHVTEKPLCTVSIGDVVDAIIKMRSFVKDVGILQQTIPSLDVRVVDIISVRIVLIWKC